MTEIYDQKDLPAAYERFILHWGDMGSQWGVNRSVAQIQALLYLSDKPLSAEDIANQLGIARSNVSNSLKELVVWKLVHRVPIKGDRRDHFAAETDPWEMATRIAEIRKAKEIDPAAEVLRDCIAEAKDDKSISPVAVKRMTEMLAFMETVDRWYTQMLKVPRARVLSMLKMGSKVVNFIPTRARDKKKTG